MYPGFIPTLELTLVKLYMVCLVWKEIYENQFKYLLFYISIFSKVAVLYFGAEQSAAACLVLDWAELLQLCLVCRN